MTKKPVKIAKGAGKDGLASQKGADGAGGSKDEPDAVLALTSKTENHDGTPLAARDSGAGVGKESAIQTSSMRFLSKDGTSMVNWQFWAPASYPKAIIQLVHGMAEHIGRYDELARHFAAKGYLVVGHDHIGHGKTAPLASELGHMPLERGRDILLYDTQNLATHVDRRYPGVPHVLYGHSMGSFIVRAYLAQWGSEVDAAVLSGTATFPLALARLGLATTRTLATLRGERAHSDLVNKIAIGSYNAAIKEPRTSFDWIAANEAVVDAYVADERCGFQFTLGGYHALMRLIVDMLNPKNAAKIPSDLPLLLVAGKEDPVGNMGKGVTAAAGLFRAAGVERVDVRLYPGMRHEVHNERGKAQVLDDIAAWLDDVICPGTCRRAMPRPGETQISILPRNTRDLCPKT